MLRSKDELRAFVAGLRIPASRRALVENELLDHLESRVAAAIAAGEDRASAEQRAVAALGDPELLRASLERVEGAFELAPMRSAIRGALSSLAAVGVLALLGSGLPDRPGLVADLAFWMVAALFGLLVLGLLAPRGIGAAMAAEARASIHRTETLQRRAVLAYTSSLFLVPCALIPAFLWVDAERLADLVLPVSMLFVGFCAYTLRLMLGARRERSAAGARHGA